MLCTANWKIYCLLKDYLVKIAENWCSREKNTYSILSMLLQQERFEQASVRQEDTHTNIITENRRKTLKKYNYMHNYETKILKN